MRSKSPLVTVYIANHNYARYLAESIQSVLDQTHQDFELIIVDDGSTDGSQEIIRQFETRSRVYCLYQENQGLNKTNNIALKLASGKYIM